MVNPLSLPQAWSFIVACNNEEVLKHTLLRSPVLADAREVIVERGHACAGTAYNAGLAKAGGEILIFLHQDVYLPPNWADAFARALAHLDDTDPNWGVLGLYGLNQAGSRIGHLYSTGLRRTLGTPFDKPREVVTLDELLLVLRRSSGLHFDEQLRGFHLYGTDICLQARRNHLKNYAVSAFCIHNSNGLRWLPRAFWQAAHFIRRKWVACLPINSPCLRITKSPWPMAAHFLGKLKELYWEGYQPGVRCEHPDKLYLELFAAAQIGAQSDTAPKEGQNPTPFPPPTRQARGRGVDSEGA